MRLSSLVCKPKVQPLHTLILRANNVVLLLFLRHSTPLPIPDLVAPDVERLDEIKQKDIDDADAQQNLVTSTIQRLVVIAVDVG